MKKLVTLLWIWLLIINNSNAQTSINAAGGDFENENATLSYSIGQIFYQTDEIMEGVQLPYNISEIVGIDDLPGIFLNISVYPNPTQDFLELKIETENFDFNDVIYQITDVNGRTIKSVQILDFHTIVEIENFPKGIYFFEVKTNSNTYKTFKIVKN